MAQLDPPAAQVQLVPRVSRGLKVNLAPQAVRDPRGLQAPRVQQVSLGPLAPRDLKVCLVQLASWAQRGLQDSQALRVSQVLRVSQAPRGSRALLELLAGMESQVLRALQDSLGKLERRGKGVSQVHRAPKGTRALLGLLARMESQVHRALLVNQESQALWVPQVPGEKWALTVPRAGQGLMENKVLQGSLVSRDYKACLGRTETLVSRVSQELWVSQVLRVRRVSQVPWGGWLQSRVTYLDQSAMAMTW